MVKKIALIVALVGAQFMVETTEVQAAALVRSDVGFLAADLKTARDAFRADIGGGLVAGEDGNFNNIRREINWDGVSDGRSTPNNLPENFFNNVSPRGVVVRTPGLALQTSSRARPGLPPLRFGNINPARETDFQALSADRLLAPIGSTIVDVYFFVPGTETPATVRAFGAVFTDVDLPDSTFMEFFDRNEESIGKFAVPSLAGSASLSFLGVIFTQGEQVAHVRITSGNTNIEGSDTAPNDVVAIDDFFYSEPAALATVNTPAVSSPAAGQSFTVGSPITINWTPALAGGTVTIQLSRNGGKTFENLFEGTADDGAEGWVVDAPGTASAIIRVVSDADRTKSGQSSGSFGIIGAEAPKILGDLGVSVSGLTLKGSRLAGKVDITNNGQGTITSAAVDAFLSKDGRIGAGDALINRFQVSNLVAGGRIGFNFNVKLAGRGGQVVVSADPGNGVPETNEGNNTVAVKAPRAVRR